MTTKQDIGLVIQTIRTKSGHNNTKRVGENGAAVLLSKETINRIETGRGNSGIDALFRIAEALKCDVSDFFLTEKSDSKLVIF